MTGGSRRSARARREPVPSEPRDARGAPPGCSAALTRRGPEGATLRPGARSTKTRSLAGRARPHSPSGVSEPLTFRCALCPGAGRPAHPEFLVRSLIVSIAAWRNCRSSNKIRTSQPPFVYSDPKNIAAFLRKIERTLCSQRAWQGVTEPNLCWPAPEHLDKGPCFGFWYHCSQPGRTGATAS